MQPTHDVYCDRNHPPRQRCNRALFPADPVESVGGTNGAGAPPMPVEEERADAQREAIAATEVPEPTAYASRAWGSTAAALEDPAYLASEREHVVEATARRGGRVAGKVALIAGAIAVAFVVGRILQSPDLGYIFDGTGRGAERDENETDGASADA